eukprot:13295629-Alexandrium_andersonii.AAC.1
MPGTCNCASYSCPQAWRKRVYLRPDWHPENPLGHPRRCLENRPFGERHPRDLSSSGMPQKVSQQKSEPRVVSTWVQACFRVGQSSVIASNRRGGHRRTLAGQSMPKYVEECTI